MRCFQICREHSPLAWQIGRGAIGATNSFRIMFQTVMRRPPTDLESGNDFVIALIHFISRSRICLSRFSGSVNLQIADTNRLSITISGDGYLEVVLPSRNPTRRLAFAYVQRAIIDAVIADAALPTRRYSLGRSKAIAAGKLTPTSDQVKMVACETVDDEIRYFIVRILRERLSLDALDQLVDAWRAEHLRSLIDNLIAPPRGATVFLVA